MKKHIKMVTIVVLALTLALTLFAGLVGCDSANDDDAPCNAENCDRHPETGTCHCHGHCGNEGCECHTGH